MRPLTIPLLGGLAIGATLAAVAFAVLYFTDSSRDSNATTCGDRSFGHIATLHRQADGFRLRFDPAWFTVGVTANVAAAEDGAVEPGEPVPNDNYRLDETHRLLTYLVAPDASVDVLTSQGDPAQFHATPITLPQLAQLLRGDVPPPVELYEPLATGVWLTVAGDTVCSIEQQYLP